MFLANATITGSYAGTSLTGSLFPQFCQFATCPNYTNNDADNSSSLTITDTTLAHVVVFSTFFVMAVSCMFIIFLLLFAGALRWQGKALLL